MATDSKPHQATVEDYFSDDGHGHRGIHIEPFTPLPSPGKANVRTKRSNPDDLGTGTGTDPPKSDSGYSSLSVAGMSSADSAASASSNHHRSPPAVPVAMVPAKPPHAPSPTPAQRPPRPAHQRQQSTQSAQSSHSTPRQPLPRRESHSSRRPAAVERPAAAERPARPERLDRHDRHERADRPDRLERRHTNTKLPPPPPPPPQPAPKRRDSRNVEECTIPGCTKCGPDAVESRSRPSRRLSLLHTQPTESAPNVSYPHPYDTRSQVSDPAQYQASSPRESRPPRVYPSQGGPVIQPAISRRLSVNAGRPARPTSYHGDPNYKWTQPGMPPSHPSPPHEYGPPLSRSAYGSNMPNGMPYGQPQMHSPYMQQYPPNFPPNPPPAFYQAREMQPTYEPSRPPLQARGSTSSGYGQPLPPVMHVERSDRQKPSARYHSSPTVPQVPSQRPRPLVDHRQEEYDDDESESDSDFDSEDEHEQDALRITAAPDPRAQKGAPRRRPGLPHANTTPAPQPPRPVRPQAVIVPERRDPRVRDRNHDLRADRRASTSRPPIIPSVKAQSTYDTPKARVVVASSRPSRRESVAYDRPLEEHRRPRQQEYEQRRPDRSSRSYSNAVDYEQDFYHEDEETAHSRAHTRCRNTDSGSGHRRIRPVEIKQIANAEDYINARRGDSETYADRSYEDAKKRSSRTSGGPSEAESSRSRGSDNNGEIRLRIGNDAPVTLSLNGDMEGRTLQLVPIENGMNELVISGNSRGGESIYRSERGSVRPDRKAIMPSEARRDAEEMTERSSHSSRRRRESQVERDEPRRVLRQSRRDRRESEYRY